MMPIIRGQLPAQGVEKRGDGGVPPHLRSSIAPAVASLLMRFEGLSNIPGVSTE
jgi:hypothetical protein